MSIIYEMVIARDDRMSINKKCINILKQFHKKLNLEKTEIDDAVDVRFINGKQDSFAIGVNPPNRMMTYTSDPLTAAISIGVELSRETIVMRNDIKIMSENKYELIQIINNNIKPYTVEKIVFGKMSIKIFIRNDDQ